MKIYFVILGLIFLFIGICFSVFLEMSVVLAFISGFLLGGSTPDKFLICYTQNESKPSVQNFSYRRHIELPNHSTEDRG